MKRMTVLLVSVLMVFCVGTIVFAEKASKDTGEAEFKKHCAVCHPEGGNIVNPKKTLHKKDLDANKIKTPADIIKTMRNPGQGMNKFDEKTVPDTDAKAVAEYILKKFK